MPAVRATCEPCRIRRVKCDLREGKVQCTNCLKRNYNCPGPGVVATRKPRRGANVDLVEQTYGEASPARNTPPAPVASIPSTPTGDTLDVAASASPIMSVPASPEQAMVRFELQTEFTSSILSTFAHTHGHMFQVISPSLSFAAVGGRFDDLDPCQEVMIRVMLALGARSTMHPVVLDGADLTSPHTLGLVREGPCRRLAEVAMERYGAHGLWRVCTLEAIQVASSLSLIAQVSFPADVCRPFVNSAVGLYRQYLSLYASQGDPYQIDPSVLKSGFYVLWTDARNSADMGVRPLWTQDDLDDWPALDLWLRQPLVFDPLADDILSDGQTRQSGLAAMVRLLRSFAADFHRPIRRGLHAAAHSLPRIWIELDKFAAFVDAQLAAATVRLATHKQPAAEATKEPFAITQLSMLCSTHSYLTFKIRELLQGAVATTGDPQYTALLAEADSRARAELKRLAAHVKVVNMLQTASGPLQWIYFTRMFAQLETTPNWTELMVKASVPDTSPSALTDEEREMITEGVRLAGFGAGFAPMRWLDILRVRGALGE